MNANATAAEIARAISEHKGRIVIVGHARPDGDAAGAALGLCLSLRTGGRSAVCAGLAPLGPEFDFFEGLDDIIPAASYVPLAGDVMVIVDCGDISRIPEELRVHAEKIIGFCIDHHKGNPGPVPMRLIDPDASSASELVYTVIEAAGLPITRGVAEALWVGMVTDTGRFSYSCTSPDTLRHAAVLLEHGARIDMINDAIYCQVELRRFRLQQRLMDSLEIHAGGKVSLASLTPEDYRVEQCTSMDSDNFVDIVRCIKGTQISTFVRQFSPGGLVNISLRTHPPYDASLICAEWGGGGHERASGATVVGDLASVKAKVLARLIEIVSSPNETTPPSLERIS